MLRVLATLVVAAIVACLSSASASAAPASSGLRTYGEDTVEDPPPGTPPAEVDPSVGEGSISVQVAVSGSTVEGESFSQSSVRSVVPVCWYEAWWTGERYFQYWDGGEAEAIQSLMPYQYRSAPFDGYEAHADDTEGHWYLPRCGSGASPPYQLEYVDSHLPVYWSPSDGGVAPSQPDVDPRLLAEIAYEFTDLPTGTIGWNPRAGGVGATVVNVDTWVWVEGAPTTVSATASVASGTWARVDAVLDRVELSAPGAGAVSCADPGVPWSEGAGSTSCAIRFARSSANLPVKAGQSVPTATLTAAAVWTASWVSSLDATPTALAPQEVVTTAEVPVAEIQALVTLG